MKRAKELAEKAIATFQGAGVFGVEMFLLPDGAPIFSFRLSYTIPKRYVGTLLINEIAPRPHNSGHYTIEACETSQYENHLRAVLGLPLGSTNMKVSSSAMLNLLGPPSKHDSAIVRRCRYSLFFPPPSQRPLLHY